MLPKSFDQVGLPNGHGFPTVAYHEPTGTLIAHTRPTRAGLPRDRLSFRRPGDPRYQPIGEFADAVSVKSFVLDSTRPVLYFVTYEFRELEGGQSAGNWDGLYRFDLERHRCARLAQPGHLHDPESNWETWIGDLLSVSNDGRGLICQATLGKSESDYAYWVAHLDLADLRLAGITKLEAVFA
jgi:hypothetical protein